MNPKWFKFYQKPLNTKVPFRIGEGDMKHTATFVGEDTILSIDSMNGLERPTWIEEARAILCVGPDGKLTISQDDPSGNPFFLITVYHPVQASKITTITMHRGKAVTSPVDTVPGAYDIITDGDEYAYIYYPNRDTWYHCESPFHSGVRRNIDGWVSESRCPYAVTLCTHHQEAIQELIKLVVEELNE